jgi:hypothetical protein
MIIHVIERCGVLLRKNSLVTAQFGTASTEIADRSGNPETQVDPTMRKIAHSSRHSREPKGYAMPWPPETGRARLIRVIRVRLFARANHYLAATTPRISTGSRLLARCVTGSRCVHSKCSSAQG